MERIRTYQRESNDDSSLQEKTENESEFGPRKTILVLTIVAGCFAVLWPKIFYPMLTSSTNTNTPHSIDNSVCCDLIFENDVNTVDILQEICTNILKHHQVDPRIRDVIRINKLSPQSSTFCRDEILTRCGIDLSLFLAEKERLGKSYKQVLEEIRSFNSSLCLKTNFGVSLSQLGIPHLIRYHILMPHTPIRQERRLPPHAGSLHPAMRERGRAIPMSHIVPRVEGKPDHLIVQQMRPPMGGAGRVVPPQGGGGGGGSSMGFIMPLYTVGILVFFLYTIAKVLKKNSNNEIYPDYSHAEAEKEFRDRVFNPDIFVSAVTGMPYYRKEKSPVSSKPPTMEELSEQPAGDIEVDQLIQRLADTEAAMERIVVQMGNLSRVQESQPESKKECSEKNCCGMINCEGNDCSASVKVVGMDLTASCEGGQKISRPTTPIIPHSNSNQEREKTPPMPIYLEGALPPQCELLVTDSETQAEESQDSYDEEAPVVLSGKMTLSLISLDQIPGGSEEINEEIDEEKANSIPQPFNNDEPIEFNNMKNEKEIFDACEISLKNEEKNCEEFSEINQIKLNQEFEEKLNKIQDKQTESAEEEELDDEDDEEEDEEEEEEEEEKKDINSGLIS